MSNPFSVLEKNPLTPISPKKNHKTKWVSAQHLYTPITSANKTKQNTVLIMEQTKSSTSSYPIPKVDNQTSFSYWSSQTI
jgi:hypothetical protein